MHALRRNATMITHEDYVDGIATVQAKKKTSLNYYAWVFYTLFLKRKNKIK